MNSDTLTSIGGFAELQSGWLANCPSGAVTTWMPFFRQSSAWAEQIETVLELSQGGRLLPLALEELEVLPLVTRLVRDREEKVRAGEISLDLRGNPSSGAIMADKRRLSRAIGHILDNAIAATAPGGRILVEVARKKAGLRIVISDNGHGMNQDEAARALDGYRMAANGSGVERRQGLASRWPAS
ncbi:MAG: ATP-binding protein [Caenibius sp.]